jgi:hypothetical protein
VDTGEVTGWTAEHDGYLSLRPPARHRRSVRLDRSARTLDISDELDGAHDARLAFHLGPEVEADLDGSHAVLRWPGAGTPGAARLLLPPELRWSLHRGETDPILGWYSAGLGQRVPAFTLLGCGHCATGAPLTTRLEFLDLRETEKSIVTRSGVSRRPTSALVGEVPTLDRETQ